MTENIKQLRSKILFSVIEILPYEAFDINIISKACENIGVQNEYANLLFPNGRAEILELFRDYIDAAVENHTEIRPSQPFVVGEKSLIEFQGETDTDNTAVSLRFSLIEALIES